MGKDTINQINEHNQENHDNRTGNIINILLFTGIIRDPFMTDNVRYQIIHTTHPRIKCLIRQGTQARKARQRTGTIQATKTSPVKNLSISGIINSNIFYHLTEDKSSPVNRW